MLSLLRTFIGTLFFLCCFGIVLLKNSPKDYRLEFSQNTNLPWATLVDVLEQESTNTENEEISFFLSSLRPLANKEQNIKRFLIPTAHFFDLIEEWQWQQQDSLLQLTYTYELSFLSKLFSFNQKLNDTVRTFGQSRFERIQSKANTLLHEHHWEYNGETTLPLTYYLAIEGESTWEELNSTVKNGHEDLKTFAQKNEIPVLENTFVLFPEINDEKIRWRAAIEVERYYRTNNSTIRCRRYKGGKALVLTHMGTAKHLPKSWSILQDSLLAHKQNYPLIQKDERTIQDSKNPLDWTTKLYAPIE
jgi:DNA gyrase inhibitor GyrI